MKKKSKLIKVLAIVIIIILLAVLAFYLFSLQGKKDSKVITAVGNYRTAAQKYHRDRGSYGSNVTAPNNVCTMTAFGKLDPYGLDALRASINTQLGVTPSNPIDGCTMTATDSAGVTTWSLYTKLPSAGVKAFPAVCADSTGQLNTYKTAAVTPPTNGAKCPAGN
jgi:type II secretory pathway pseudopilin PulG